MTLFDSESVGTWHNRQAGRLREKAAELEKADVADQAAAVAKIVPATVSEIPQFLPDDAVYETYERPSGVRVSVRIPARGQAHYLTLRPAELPSGQRPTGEVTGVSFGDRVPGVELTHDFASDTTGEQVKDWARAELQKVQLWLDQVAQEVGAASIALRSQAEELVRDRTHALDAAARLKAELGQGL